MIAVRVVENAYVLRLDQDGRKVWITYRLDLDRTHPWWLEYVDESGQMLMRSRHRTMKAASDSYFYREE